MQAMTLPETENRNLAQELMRLRDTDGITFAAIGEATGVNRTTISQHVNQGIRLKPEQSNALWGYVAKASASNDAPMTIQPSRACKTTVEMYQTTEFKAALGWCSFVREERKMGVMVGHPGSGKTTILKRFAAMTPGVCYLEAWPGMRMGDMLEAIAHAVGVSLRGNNYRKAQELIAALEGRTDIALIIDEAEYLKKWDVDKFEVLRKIWDNTGTPVILAGTMELEAILTRGSGKDNLAQLYRRKVEIKLSGVKESEARAILADYDITPDAAIALASHATDLRHGGMGCFVEILALCLKSVDGGPITMETVASARKYKLLF